MTAVPTRLQIFRQTSKKQGKYAVYLHAFWDVWRKMCKLWRNKGDRRSWYGVA